MWEYIEKKVHSSFKRYCKTMELRNDSNLIEAYKKAHAMGQAWPEITQGMRDVGILDMEIYITGTRLFMIMDTVTDFDHDKAMASLALMPRQTEWESYMSKYQDSSVDSAANDKWKMIERIYKMGE